MKAGLAMLLTGSACLVASFLPAQGLGSAAVETSSRVDSFVPVSPPGLLSFIGSDADNLASVSIDEASNEYLVVDQAGLTAGQNCLNTSPTTARCSRFNTPQSSDSLVASLDDGDDRFRILAASRSGRVLGGHGDDRISGSAANSALVGDAGEDRLHAFAGKDILVGGPGHDQLYGGADDDRIHADHDDRDRKINCGPGRDKVFIDRELDPRPKNCEQVRLRG
jgi:RTX calcium-binding nonapeptide repeat (4 copies)